MLTFYRHVRTGKAMPFNGEPVVLRTRVDEDAQTGATRQAVELDLADTHFASCPDAARFRTGGRS